MSSDDTRTKPASLDMSIRLYDEHGNLIWSGDGNRIIGDTEMLDGLGHTAVVLAEQMAEYLDNLSGQIIDVEPGFKKLA